MPKLTQRDKTDRTRTRRKKWQVRFLAALAKAPSISHAAKAAGVHRSTCYAVRDSDPQFAKAWEQSLETAVDALVVAAFQRALRGSDTLLTFLLRCHRPAIYNISSRIEQIGEKEEPKKVGLTILYETGGAKLEELLDFPIDESMRGTEGFVPDTPEQIAAKQAKLCGDAPEPAPAVSDASESEVPAGYEGLPAGYVPPPQAVPKSLTGRIREEWKRNSQ